MTVCMCYALSMAHRCRSAIVGAAVHGALLMGALFAGGGATLRRGGHCLAGGAAARLAPCVQGWGRPGRRCQGLPAGLAAVIKAHPRPCDWALSWAPAAPQQLALWQGRATLQQGRHHHQPPAAAAPSSGPTHLLQPAQPAPTGVMPGSGQQQSRTLEVGQRDLLPPTAAATAFSPSLPRVQWPWW